MVRLMWSLCVLGFEVSRRWDEMKMRDERIQG
jgi:hypothetical protein